jgi:dihydroxyacid dehydratase/phosphogluconate dehydratase
METGACGTGGACQVMGTACTMQVMAESPCLALAVLRLGPPYVFKDLAFARARRRQPCELASAG